MIAKHQRQVSADFQADWIIGRDQAWPQSLDRAGYWTSAALPWPDE